jgi:hypothetical protein
VGVPVEERVARAEIAVAAPSSSDALLVLFSAKNER